LSISFRSNFSSLHVTAGIEEPRKPEEHSVAQRLLEEDVEEATEDREKIIDDSKGTIEETLPKFKSSLSRGLLGLDRI
jgi:vacuolar-type H+-ATPase subunit H